jgi:hypothetical protein
MHAEERKSKKMLVGKREGKSPLISGWKYNIKVNLNEIRCEYVD